MMEIRDTANARLEALRERADAYKAGGEKIPDHLAGLLKDAEKAGGTARAETRQPDLKPKATTRKTPDGTGYFYEDGHGIEPKHADSTDADGFHVPRPADAPGATPLPDMTGELNAVEPVEKFPDFANPAKKGAEIPKAAHDRGVVPEHMKGGSEKSMEQIVADRMNQKDRAGLGKAVDPAKAQNATPDPHQVKVANEATKPKPSSKVTGK